jgi:hypothetical protein
MLRGNPLADLEGVLQVTEGTCLVAPALPAEGRVTVAGVQHWPGGEADLRVLLRPLGERVQLCDAASDEDLLAIAVIPLHVPSRPSAHCGTSCNRSTSGWSLLASRTISSR